MPHGTVGRSRTTITPHNLQVRQRKEVAPNACQSPTNNSWCAPGAGGGAEGGGGDFCGKRPRVGRRPRGAILKSTAKSELQDPPIQCIITKSAIMPLNIWDTHHIL